MYAQNAVLYSSDYGFEIDGGAAAITTNTINSNGVAGVHVSGVAGILISENQIYNNSGPGIELVNGANNDQPAPVLSSATANGPNTEVVGSLSGATPGTQYQIQLFRSPTCGSGSNPQGADFISNFDQTTDGNGHFDFDASNNVAGTGNVITATAIAPDGSTSVFSACVTASGGGGNAQPGPTFTVNSEDNHDDSVCSDTDCTLSEAINAANTQAGLNTIHFDVPNSGQLTIAWLVPGRDRSGRDRRDDAAGDRAVFDRRDARRQQRPMQLHACVGARTARRSVGLAFTHFGNECDSAGLWITRATTRSPGTTSASWPPTQALGQCRIGI